MVAGASEAGRVLAIATEARATTAHDPVDPERRRREPATASAAPAWLRYSATATRECSFAREAAAAEGATAHTAALLLRGLLFGFGVSVMSDAKGKVPTGGELTLFEAVGRARA